jgi:hypothetical protein
MQYSIRHRGNNAKDSGDDEEEQGHLLPEPHAFLQGSNKSQKFPLHGSGGGISTSNNNKNVSADQPSIAVSFLLALASHASQRLVLFFCTIIAILIVLLLIVVVVSLSTLLTGSRYDSTGGLVGTWADGHLLRKYAISVQEQERLKDQELGIVYPDVTIKATRKVETAHVSTYLREILRRHQLTNHPQGGGAVLFRNGSSGQSRIDGPSSHLDGAVYPTSGSSSTPRTVAIHGLDTFQVTARTLEQELRAESCTSNWLCQRCLNTGLAGTYEACTMFCRHCYIRILSSVPYNKKKTLEISLRSVQGDRADAAMFPRKNIPPIVHQAFLVYPTILNFPDLSRIQSGWRSLTGYEYQFYTFQRQREFLEEHYPQAIVKAYDKISNAHRMRDFFKLLVLYRMGGVVANS